MSNAHQARQSQDRHDYLNALALERHAAVENEGALAKLREVALRSELAEQSRIIKELVRRRLGRVPVL